ncbi:MAG: DUF2029 domain-containing protein [Chloroflexi bacterium]|nr:DUF2029 domain-containing protein [Chloroflexota bacterium]
MPRMLAWRRAGFLSSVSDIRRVRLLTWRRARFYVLVIAAILAFAWVQSIVAGEPPLNAGGVPIGGDYIAFYTAGRLVLSGEAAQIYDHDTVAAFQHALLDGRANDFHDAFRNPPFLALMFAPLALLDLLPSVGIWTLLSIACLIAACWLMLQRLPSLRPAWRGIALAVFAFGPVYFNLVDGENAAVSLLLYVLLYRALTDGHDRRAGVWAALGLFKPQLFFVFPLVFLATRRWRALTAYGLVAAALGAISVMLVGVEGVQSWLRALMDTESLNAAHNSWRMLSLKTFFELVLPDAPVVSLLLYAACAILLVGLLLRAWRHHREGDLPLLWAATSLVAVLVDPHLVDYDLSVLVPAALLAIVLIPRTHWPMAIFYVLILFRGAVPIGSATLQLGTLLLLACLFIVWPRQPSATRASTRPAALETVRV